MWRANRWSSWKGLLRRRPGLALVGNAGWYSRGAEARNPDEQPTDAAAFVLAFRGAYLATDDPHYLRRMREAFAWFMGENRLRLALYDFATGGCAMGSASAPTEPGRRKHDLPFARPDRVLDLAGEGLEHADASEGTSH